MHVLFSHTNFPGQFGAFGAWLASQGWGVTFATGRRDAKAPARTQMLHFDAAPGGAPETHRHARSFDRAIRTAESFAAACVKHRKRGLEPDVVVAHSGWGAGAYAKAVWPDAAFIPYLEWWYRWPRADRHPAEPEPGDPVAMAARASALNAPLLHDIAQADAIWCPSRFQAAQCPEWLRQRLTIMPDGVDTASFAPDPQARARLAELGVAADAEIVTYATRGMEPYRGFPEFMRALARLQRVRPRLTAIIAGEDRVCYGTPLPEGESWKARMLAELDLDLSRVIFTGLLPGERYRTVLRGTDAHVYLTLPFVLSWSLIEAMSVGSALIASDVAPVREAVGDGAAAVLVDHHDIDALTRAIAATLDDPAAASARGARARRRAIDAYGRHWIWPARAALLRATALDGTRAL